MKIIILTRTSHVISTADVDCSCAVNEDEADALVAQLKRLGEPKGFEVHCVALDTQSACLAYLGDGESRA